MPLKTPNRRSEMLAFESHTVPFVITTEQNAKREIVIVALLSPFESSFIERGPMTLSLHSPIPELRAQAEQARRLSRCTVDPDDARTMELCAIELEREAHELELEILDFSAVKGLLPLGRR